MEPKIQDTHELKIQPKYFQAVISRNKTFEIRRHDRDFKSGDILRLREYENEEYTGRACEAQVLYILTSWEFEGIKHGYVALSIQFLKNLKTEERR